MTSEMGQSEILDGLHICDAFIVLGSEPVRMGAVPSSLTNSSLYTLGDYVPRWMRRSRLRRVRPLVRRVLVLSALWRWSEGKPGPECVVFRPYPPDRP